MNKWLVGGLGIFVVAGVGLAIFFNREPGSISELGPLLKENGFVEIKPPSTLFEPGTWVEVLGRDPLHLSIVCKPIQALGAKSAGAVEESASLDLGFESSLSANFSMDAKSLKLFKGEGELEAIRNVTFKLSNVRLVELPDAVIFDGFGKRTRTCKDAIEFRLKGPNAVSMVKSVLVADVEYDVAFESETTVEAKSKASANLAMGLGVSVSAEQESTTKLRGKELVWGIRDDSILARFGYELPSTGSSAERRSILFGAGPVTTVRDDSQVRREFEPGRTLARYDLIPVKQPTANGCWATVYTMMRSWRDEKKLSISETVRSLGPEYVEYFVRDTGLPGGQELAFVSRARMIAQPPANYSLRGYRDLMTRYGPLWIIVGDGISSHALVLVGLYGGTVEESIEAYEEAIFEFIDPLTGTYSYRPALDFLKEFEREAAILVNSKADGVPLRWQILHWSSELLGTKFGKIGLI